MRYLVFSGATYYACGGFNDFVGAFELLKYAMLCGEKCAGDYNWYHVVDAEDNFKIVAKSEQQAHGN